MTFNEFHNGLRILLNIDRDEFETAVGLRDDPFPDGRHYEWERFRDNPHRWFIAADSAKAEGIWMVILGRNKHYHVSGSTQGLPPDMCAVCHLDIRNEVHLRVGESS